MKTKRVKYITKKTTNRVYDLTVDGNHNYVDENGVIHHNSGLVYGSSLIINFTKRQDKDGKVLNGHFVTAKPEKNRFCKPIPVEFKIGFTEGMNPFVGLQEYASWDICGIQRGKFLTQKEYDKLSEADKKKMRFCKDDMWFMPSETARGICTDSGEVFPLDGMFKRNVWTDDRLKRVDEYIKGIFEYAKGDAGMNDVLDMLVPQSEDEEDDGCDDGDGIVEQVGKNPSVASGAMDVDDIFNQIPQE